MSFNVFFHLQVTRLREYQGVDPHFDAIARRYHDLVQVCALALFQLEGFSFSQFYLNVLCFDGFLVKILDYQITLSQYKHKFRPFSLDWGYRFYSYF